MKRRIEKGFTLIELLVVISILAVLVTMAMTGLPYIAKMSRIKSTTTLLYTIETAALTYYEQYNMYPPESADGKRETGPLFLALTNSKIHSFSDAQIKNNLLVDAWGEPIMYMKPRKEFKVPKLWSKGPNRKDNDGNLDPERNWDDICNLQGKGKSTPTPTGAGMATPTPNATIR